MSVGFTSLYERGLTIEVVRGEDVLEPVEIVVRKAFRHFERNFGVPGHVHIDHDERVFAEDLADMRCGAYCRVVFGVVSGPAMAELVGGISEVAV